MHFLLDGMFATTVHSSRRGRFYLENGSSAPSLSAFEVSALIECVMYVVERDQLVNIYAILSSSMPCISHSELEFSLNAHTPKSIQTRLKARVYTEKNQVTREIFHGISFQSIP